MSGRSPKKGPTWTRPDTVGRVVDRMLEDSDEARRRADARRDGRHKPVTLATGRWIRCPDCKGGGIVGWAEAERRNLPRVGNKQAGVACPRCGGDGEIPEPVRRTRGPEESG
jgi:DNA-directed RNA polymerase subunit RPC12/RpoP